MLRFDQLAQAETPDRPFAHVVASDLLAESDAGELDRAFPDPGQPGFFPVETLNYGDSFGALIEDLRSRRFSELVGERLGVDLAERPQMIVVRKWSALRDGRPHTDGPDKVATGLLYLNDDWQGEAGSLRYLEGPDLDGPGTAPIAARYGRFTAFARSDTSWHGHKPFAGERRVVQVFWLKDAEAAARKTKRHKRTGWLRALGARFRPT